MNVEPRVHRRGAVNGLVAVVIGLSLLAAGCAKDPEFSNNSNSQGSSASTASTVPASIDKEATAGAPQVGGTLNFGLAAETNSWNPYIGQWAGSAYIVAGTIFDPLAAFDPAGKPQPYLAKSFTPNADFTEWTIKLRPGITFHNGQKLDAEAVRKNLQTGRDSGLTKPAFVTISSLDVVDDLTLSVKFSQPWSTFPATLATQGGYMAAPAQLDDTVGGQSNPVGTGPFVFTNWTRDNSLSVRKNSTYWQDKLPYLDGIDFKVLPDSQARNAAIESGSVDAMEVATPDAVAKYRQLAQKGDYQMYTDNARETDETIIALNTSKPPFDDPLARQALATGLDQRDLSETSYDSVYPPAWGPVTEGSPYYLSPDAAGYPKYDPEKARQLVDQYKAKHPGEEFKFSALIPPDPVYTGIAQALQQRAKEFGVTVDLVTTDQATLITKVITGDYQASGFVLYSTPDIERSYVFVATDPQPGLSLNFTRIVDPDIKKAMDQARTTLDPAKQGEQYKQVQKLLAKDLDKVFLVHNIGAIVYRNNVHGIRNTDFPDTDTPAYANSYTSPFLTATWKDQATK